MATPALSLSLPPHTVNKVLSAADVVPWLLHFGWWLRCLRWPHAGVEALGSDGSAGGCGACDGGTTCGVGFVQARSAVCHKFNVKESTICLVCCLLRLTNIK